jgi:hypothetical protein
VKRIVDSPQTSDMGNGLGHIEFPEGTTLKEMLNWIYHNAKTWGTITIFNCDGVVRCFDYDLYNANSFYHHLSGWQYQQAVHKVEFNYCFMGEDIEIYIE